MSLTRRQLVRSLGLSLLAAPFAGALLDAPSRTRVAHAAPSTKAKRLLIVFTPNGTVPSRYWPTGTSASYSFAPGSILEPLAPVQDKVVVCKGINFSDFDNHQPGMQGMLTGEPGAGLFGGMSVDQYIAGKLASTDRFPSIGLGVLTDEWGAQAQTRMSYSDAATFVSPQQDPAAAFSRLFAAAATGGDASAAALLATRRKSVLDFLTTDANRLRARLGATERTKLDAHLAAIRSVESSLFPTGGSTGGAACTSPSAPSALDPNDPANFPAIGKAQMDLAVLAMKCDLAPVVTLQWSHTVSPVAFSWLGQSTGHHELSHAQNDDFVNAERWYAQQFVYLVQQLDAAGLLADSLVVWTKELGDSALHDAIDVPCVMAGQAGGALAPGRFLDFGGVTHHQLLASMVTAMGLDTTGLGADATPLAGLFS